MKDRMSISDQYELFIVTRQKVVYIITATSKDILLLLNNRFNILTFFISSDAMPLREQVA